MKSFLKEFKDFIATGNMVELAVAVILAGAVGSVISAFTKGVVMQIIAAIVGKPDFDALNFTISGTPIFYGTVITAFINLVMIGLVLFMLIKAYNRMRRDTPGAGGPTEIDLLTEIRDALKARD